jgi:chorismate mutase/prephenate dehydratase
MSHSQEARDPDRTAARAAASGSCEGELAPLRAAIDAVDRAILSQLNERARLVEAVGAIKARDSLPVYSAAREREVIAALGAANAGPFPTAAIEPVFRQIISATRSLEGPQRIAFLGPAGTFSHLAARRHFGESAQFVPLASIDAVFGAVERGEIELGVVPVENTTEGVVTRTLDAFVASEVAIAGETVQRIVHCLLSQSGRREDVRRVASIGQALAQCRVWLDAHLPGIERIETESTAAAATLAAQDAGVAAIASSLAGEAYGLVAVATGIEDRRDNTTRFLLLARTAPARSGRDLTSVVFTVRKAQAGALHQLLAPFARHGVNLTSIQSRPMPGKPFEYLFFFDLEGHRDDAAVAKALAEAAAVAHSARVLGSFPRAADEASP